jgi:hypothetical protein
VDDREQCDGTPDCSMACLLVVRTEDAGTLQEAVSTTVAEAGDPPEWFDPWDGPEADNSRSKKSHGCAVRVATSSHDTNGVAFLVLFGLSLACRRGTPKRAGPRERRS